MSQDDYKYLLVSELEKNKINIGEKTHVKAYAFKEAEGVEMSYRYQSLV